LKLVVMARFLKPLRRLGKGVGIDRGAIDRHNAARGQGNGPLNSGGAIGRSEAVAAANPLLSGPILPTLIRFALPNMAAMLAGSLAAIAETAYVGRLGVPALAGMAIVFPIIMLQMMLSGGAMGGGVSSAVARALGAGDQRRANALIGHTLIIGTVAGIVIASLVLSFGTPLFRTLGGKGEALDQAVAFASVAFLGSVGVWLVNLLAAALRGAGNMGVPSATLFAMSALQIVIGGALGLGLGPFPRLGMPGIAAGQVISTALGTAVLIVYLLSGRASVRLDWRGFRPEGALFADILKVGAAAAVSPLQSILTILLLNRFVAGFGATALAGFGIGTRFEFLLTPIAFAVGVAAVPLVGSAIGAGMVARARQAAWTAAKVGAAGLGVLGIILALVPTLWARMFTDDPATLATAALYFRFAGPAYAFFGVGMCLFFSSMAAGKVLGVVLAGTVRLVVVAAGGTLLIAHGAPLWTFFALIACGLVSYGTATAVAVRVTPWGQKADSTALASAARSAA
jgi:putative MATE family efflux protein